MQQGTQVGSGSGGSFNIYDTAYAGPAYSVKYLGIVDGSMGILSRKMALQKEAGQFGTKQVSGTLH